MRIAFAFVAGATLLLSGVTAEATESKASAMSTLSADALWAKVGDFCGIGNWLPSVDKCELSADGKRRTLSLKGGGTIVEKLVKMNTQKRYYTYSIVKGPLPVTHYRSTISVAAHGTGSVVTWKGKYDVAQGGNADDTKKTVDGLYASGVKSLTTN
jgi:Polyketide cyclase / dehydrase and lipid transport